MQPSASRTELLLGCPRPFDPELEDAPDAPGEGARYGSAFHKILASCLRTGGRGQQKAPLEATSAYEKHVERAAKEFDVRASGHELAGHVKGSVKVLRNWLAREKLEVANVEEAYGVKPGEKGRWVTRPILPHDDEHRYEVEKGEIPGTVDLLARNASRKRYVVMDHKTGSGDTDNFARPLLVPQMRTLGLIAPYEPEVAIFHADRRGLPVVYSDQYEYSEQIEHSKALYEALGRIGSGFLRTGPQCKYCPARTTCPTQVAGLLEASTVALVEGANKLAVEPIVGPLVPAKAQELTVEERAGLLYDLLKKFRELDEAGRTEIKRLVKEGKIIETRDGSTLTIQTQEYETLSKKSVIEALGKLKGDKELERLRKLGAMKHTKREMLIPEKP